MLYKEYPISRANIYADRLFPAPETQSIAAVKYTQDEDDDDDDDDDNTTLTSKVKCSTHQ